MRKLSFLVVLLVFGSVANVFAGQKATQLDSMVVEVTRTDLDYKKIPAAVQVITSNELENKPKTDNFYDAVKNAVGVHTDLGSGMGWATIKVRGETPTVLFNGVNINPYISSYPFNILTAGTGAVERIEILKGSQAATHGSGSMSGVMNVVMKKGSAENQYTKLNLRAGSNETLDGSFSISGGEDKLAWFFNYAQKSADDYDTPEGKISYTDSRYKNLYGRLDYLVSKNHEISLETMYSDGKYRTGGNNYFYINDGSNNKIWQNEPTTTGVFLKYAGDFNRFTLSGTAGYMENSLDYVYGNAPYDVQSFLNADNHCIFDEDSYVADIKSKIDIVKDGILNAHLNYSHKTTKASASSKGPFGYDYDSTNHQNSFVGQLESKPLPYVYMVAGARFDGYERDDGDSSDHTSPNVGISIYPFANTSHNWTTIWASYSEAFKIPPANYLYLPPAMGGNKDLKNEESEGWEIGVKQQYSHWALFSLSYFKTDYSNRIVFDLAKFKLNNVGESEAEGFEAQLELYPVENLTLYMNYIDMERIDKKTDDRLYASPNPDSKLVFGVLAEDIYRFNFSFEGAYYIDFKLSDGEAHPTEGKVLLDAKVSYDLYKKNNFEIKPYLTLTNITDETVYCAGDTPGIQPGRCIFAGVGMTYNF